MHPETMFLRNRLWPSQWPMAVAHPNGCGPSQWPMANGCGPSHSLAIAMAVVCGPCSMSDHATTVAIPMAVAHPIHILERPDFRPTAVAIANAVAHPVVARLWPLAIGHGERTRKGNRQAQSNGMAWIPCHGFDGFVPTRAQLAEKCPHPSQHYSHPAECAEP